MKKSSKKQQSKQKQQPNVFLILLCILVVIAVILYFSGYLDGLFGAVSDVREDWMNYPITPPYYRYIRNGVDPLRFFRKDRFRKPYRWPFTYYSSYPEPHMRHLE